MDKKLLKAVGLLNAIEVHGAENCMRVIQLYNVLLGIQKEIKEKSEGKEYGTQER